MLPVAITSPAPGEVLRGQVTIIGTTDVPSFVSAQLDFAYASNPTDTWFTIQTFSQPVLILRLRLGYHFHHRR